MARAPLYTVTNTGNEPRLARFGGRSVPIDIGRDKSLPLTEDEAIALRNDGFKVNDPTGKSVPRAAKAKPAKD